MITINSATPLATLTISNLTIRVTWQTVPGRTNALEALTSDGFTNDFPLTLVIVDTTSSVTNHLDMGAAGGSTTSRFYRVRLVP